MKKSFRTKISFFVVLVLSLAIFSTSGNIYAQQEGSSTNMANMMGNSENSGNNTDMTSMASVTSDDEHGNETSVNTVSRDSQTVLLEDKTLPAGSFIHLYDTTPYQLMNGHIATKLPCDENNDTSVNVLVGVAPALNAAEFEFIPELSEAGNMCLYHVDVESNATNPITDIAIQNNSTEDITFPATSTVVIGVNEIAPFEEDHEHNE
ncbi:MAG: hypothetical protein R2685_02585 [Candidatus Nitrosocosmicus sp.]|nr:hypothetical protein [Candidatus Nitrosocosmicus sp.]